MKWLVGPFVVGSTVTVSQLDKKGSPTGETFLTQTSNDKGEFSVDFKAAGLVSLQGEGFYYNEVARALSSAPITLRALYSISQAGTQAAYINMVTHLSYLRARFLYLGGASLADATKQAESELRSQLAITAADFDPGAAGIDMNILGGDSPANAYLLAVSAALGQAAGTDAGLQELANTIQTDLEEDGKLGATNKCAVGKGLLTPA